MADDDIWAPTEFLQRFEHAAGIEDGAFSIVFIFLSVFVGHEALVEVVVVVDEVNLHACNLDGGHFDDERMVSVVNHDV